MSNSSRINKATSELNKAEERLLNSLGLSDELIDYLSDVLKTGEIATNLQRIIDSDILTQAENKTIIDDYREFTNLNLLVAQI